jgi:hypothetical protein
MAKKVYGPYKGSKQNGGRKIYVIKNKGKTTSTNKARLDYERANGKSLPRSVSVDHKDNRKNNDSRGNLRTISRSKNTAKENKRRAGKR